MELIIGTITIVSLLFALGLMTKVHKVNSYFFGALLFLVISLNYFRLYLIAIANWEQIDQFNPFLYSYINSFRVAQVQKDLRDPSKDQWTILALALETDFNSKSTFNAVFRKHVGMTPIAFKKAENTVKNH